MSVIERLEKLENAFQLICGKFETNHKHVNMLHLENESMAMVVQDAYVTKLREIEEKVNLCIKKLNEVIECQIQLNRRL